MQDSTESTIPWHDARKPERIQHTAYSTRESRRVPIMRESRRDMREKIKQLREGYWEKDDEGNWSDYLYWSEKDSCFQSSVWDDTLGTRGWWRFLYHEGRVWQPKELADHLEQEGCDDHAPGAQEPEAEDFRKGDAVYVVNEGAGLDVGTRCKIIAVCVNRSRFQTVPEVTVKLPDGARLTTDARNFRKIPGSSGGALAVWQERKGELQNYHGPADFSAPEHPWLAFVEDVQYTDEPALKCLLCNAWVTDLENCCPPDYAGLHGYPSHANSKRHQSQIRLYAKNPIHFDDWLFKQKVKWHPEIRKKP